MKSKHPEIIAKSTACQGQKVDKHPQYSFMISTNECNVTQFKGDCQMTVTPQTSAAAPESTGYKREKNNSTPSKMPPAKDGGNAIVLLTTLLPYHRQ